MKNVWLCSEGDLKVVEVTGVEGGVGGRWHMASRRYGKQTIKCLSFQLQFELKIYVQIETQFAQFGFTKLAGGPFERYLFSQEFSP